MEAEGWKQDKKDRHEHKDRHVFTTALLAMLSDRSHSNESSSEGDSEDRGHGLGFLLQDVVTYPDKI